MAITYVSGRQEVISARASFALADLTSGTAVPAIKIPAGARIHSVILRIETAFNSGTTDALVVQSSEGTPKAYITIAAALNSLPASKVFASDFATAGTASSNVAYKFTTPVTIDIKWTGAGTAATTGAGVLLVNYTVDSREEHSYQ